MAVSMDPSIYSSYTALTKNTKSTELDRTLQSDMSEASDEELLSACKQFEAYFVEKMYQTMEKTTMKSEEDENPYESYFGDMLTQKYAESATEGEGMGIAKVLYDQMKRNYSPVILTEIEEGQ